MKLTARNRRRAHACRSARPTDFEWDDAMPGFGFRLRVAAGGKINRTWIVQYRHGGATRRMLLGSAAVLGAEQARVMAMKALGQVANGTDPQADRQDRRDKDKQTFRSIVADYLAIKQRDVRGAHLTREDALPDRQALFRAAARLRARPDHPRGRGRPVEPHQLGKQPDCRRARPRPAFRAVFLGTDARPDRSQPGESARRSRRAGKPRERVLSDAELAAHLEGVR